MDLERFNEVENLHASRSAESLSPDEALEEIDNEWYSPASRRARWMDLLGDYAGGERFIIDGELV